MKEFGALLLEEQINLEEYQDILNEITEPKDNVILFRKIYENGECVEAIFPTLSIEMEPVLWKKIQQVNDGSRSEVKEVYCTTAYNCLVFSEEIRGYVKDELIDVNKDFLMDQSVEIYK